MEIYLNVNEDNIVEGWDYEEVEGAPKIEVEENHPLLANVGKFKYVDGELIELDKEIYLIVNPNNNVIEGWSGTPAEGHVKIEVPRDHPVIENTGQFKYIDGELFRMSQPEIDSIYKVPEPPKDADRINMLEDVILQLMMRG